MKKAKLLVTDLLFDIISGLLYGTAINMFTAVNSIAPGGVSGVSTLINHLFGTPIGTMSLIINIPLLVVAYKKIGRSYGLNTLRTVFIHSILMDNAFWWVVPYTENNVIAALFGGVLIGSAIGVMMMRGGSTGGTDIAGRLIQKQAPHIPIGKILIMIDVVVLGLSVAVYKNLEPAMLGMITMFVATKVIDSLLYGMDSGTMMFIVSDKAQEIGQGIYTQIGRGATLLSAKGAFTGDDRQVVLCAVRRNQSVKLRRVVYQIDSNAFIMTTEANEILGFGFNPINKE